MISPALLFILRIVWVFGVFCVSTQIVDFFFYSVKRCHWNFDRNCIESVESFGSHKHFNNIILPIREHKISSHLYVSSSISFINV